MHAPCSERGVFYTCIQWPGGCDAENVPSFTSLLQVSNFLRAVFGVMSLNICYVSMGGYEIAGSTV